MRRRLVAAFVGLTFLVVAAYALPRAYVTAGLVRSAEEARVDRTAEVLGPLLDERIADGDPVTAAYVDGMARDGEHLEVTGLPSGPDIVGGLPAGGSGSVSASEDLADGGRVTVTRVGTAVDDEISRAVLPLVLLGLLLCVLAGIAGLLLARRLSRPFIELAAAAEEVGEGRFHPDLPSYDVPEADAIGRALVRAGHRLDDLIEAEREVAVHASHQLRTPVTALRLELEDLATWSRTPAEVRTELDRCVAELDRLEQAIGHLLAGAEERRAARAVDVDLEALGAEAVARHARPSVVHRPSGPAPARVDPRAVRQVLDLLLGDALTEGEERLDVTVVSHPGHHEVQLVGGPGEPREQQHSWARVQDLAVSAGAHVAHHGATRVLRVPRGAGPPGPSERE